MLGENYTAFIENFLLFEHFKYLMKGFSRKTMFNHKVKLFNDDQIEIVKYPERVNQLISNHLLEKDIK